MIVAKTRIRKLPKTCKTCPLAVAPGWGEDKVCSVTHWCCPMVQTPNGNWAYSKPGWCPLIDLEVKA